MPTAILWVLLGVSACISLCVAVMGVYGVMLVRHMRRKTHWRKAIVRQLDGEDGVLLRVEGETEKVHCQLPRAKRWLSRSLEVLWCKQEGVVLTRQDDRQSRVMLVIGVLLLVWSCILMFLLSGI